jgi:GGDEF domain-containing protein
LPNSGRHAELGRAGLADVCRAFWLLALITGVSTLAGMSQLAFMIALVRQAIRDPLTGVFPAQRRGNAGSAFTIAQRSNAALSIAFIDLDHFKSINDSFGHEAGDVF